MYKMNFFFFQNSYFNIIWTRPFIYQHEYFNDVNVGRNGLINSQLKRILFIAATRKNEAKMTKTEKKHGKKSNSDESDFSENQIPDLNSLKAFEIEPKTNIGDINSSSSDEEEGAKYKVKRISNSGWCECSRC